VVTTAETIWLEKLDITKPNELRRRSSNHKTPIATNWAEDIPS